MENAEIISKTYWGKLTYLINATRPDIVFAASLLNRFSADSEKSNISN